jgi:hypothetical protein
MNQTFIAKHGQHLEMYSKGLGESILKEIKQNVVLLPKTSFFLAMWCR